MNWSRKIRHLQWCFILISLFILLNLNKKNVFGWGKLFRFRRWIKVSCGLSAHWRKIVIKNAEVLHWMETRLLIGIKSKRKKPRTSQSSFAGKGIRWYALTYNKESGISTENHFFVFKTLWKAFLLKFTLDTRTKYFTATTVREDCRISPKFCPNIQQVSWKKIKWNKVNLFLWN